MNIRQKAKEIASSMYERGLYPWQVEDEVKSHAFIITKSEEEKLIKYTKEELENLRPY